MSGILLPDDEGETEDMEAGGGNGGGLEAPRLLKVGDRVVCKSPANRWKGDNAWFAGNVLSVDGEACTVLCADGDTTVGITFSEIYAAPNAPDNVGKASHRSNSLDATLASYSATDKFNVTRVALRSGLLVVQGAAADTVSAAAGDCVSVQRCLVVDPSLDSAAGSGLASWDPGDVFIECTGGCALVSLGGGENRGDGRDGDGGGGGGGGDEEYGGGSDVVCSGDGWAITRRPLAPNDAVIVSYNVAHLLGCRNQMKLAAGGEKIACIEEAWLPAFARFHARALLSLQADVIVTQEHAGVHDDSTCGEMLAVGIIVMAMNDMLEEMQSDHIRYEWKSVADEGKYWHHYAVISRLPLTHFTEEEPKVCQGMVGVTATLPSRDAVRIYNAHLYYKPECQEQANEVEAHAAYISGEDAQGDDQVGSYDWALWGGDFNNESLSCPNMRTIRGHGFHTDLPYHYVDTFFWRRRQRRGGGGKGGGSGSGGSGGAREGMIGNDDSNGSGDRHDLRVRYLGAVANFITHTGHTNASDPDYGTGPHSDHMPVAIVVSL